MTKSSVSLDSRLPSYQKLDVFVLGVGLDSREVGHVGHLVTGEIDHLGISTLSIPRSRLSRD